MTSAEWSFPTRIRIGPGRVAEVPLACAELGIERPLVVTDRGLADADPFRTVVEAVGAACRDHAVFTDVRPDPTSDDVSRGVAVSRDHGCDGIVAVGGGSALDVGKIIALMVRQDVPVWTFTDGASWRRVPAVDVAPIVAVPTTAGTGSEVGRAGVLTDGHRTKRVVFHPAMLPSSVVCDPELTVGLPPWLTAGTGLDAFSHALEAYCSPAHHPMADGIAVEAMGMILEHLPVVMVDPTDVGARQQLLAAALMGAVAFQKGLGAMHALAHPLGAHHGTHHGTTNAVLMPYVLIANRPVIDARLDRLAARLGLGRNADDVVDAVLELRRQVGIPHTLGALGVDHLDPARIAAAAVADPSAGTNPVPVTERYATSVLEAACTGDLAAPAPEPV